MNYGNHRFFNWVFLSYLVCFQALNCPAQIHGLGTTGFDCGITYDGCGTLAPAWFHVSGTVTADRSVGAPYVAAINQDVLLNPGYNGIFNGMMSGGTWVHVYYQITFSEASGYPSTWEPMRLPWLDGSAFGFTRQGGMPLAGPNYIGVARPKADGGGPANDGCGNDLKVSSQNYTNNTASTQHVTPFNASTGGAFTNSSGQAVSRYVQPGQVYSPSGAEFIVPFFGGQIGWNVENSIDLSPGAAGPGTMTLTPQSDGSYVVGGSTGINNPSLPMNGGASAGVLSNPTNVSGPIIWDNGTGGAAAQDSTLKAGFSELANDLIQIHNSQGGSNTSGASGSSSGMTNLTVSVSNWPTNFSTSGSTNNFFAATNVNIGNWPTNFSMGSNTNNFSAATNVSVNNWPQGFSNALWGIYSNTLATGTNGVGWTNGLTEEQLTNWVSDQEKHASNDFEVALMFALGHTNEAAALDSYVVGEHLGFAHDVSGLEDVFGGGAVSPEIQVGGADAHITYLFGGVTGMPAFSGLRTLVKWCMIMTLFCLVWRSFMANIRRMFFVTANAVDLGLFNTVGAGTAAAVVVAGLIMGIAAAFVAYTLPIVLGFADTVASSGGSHPMFELASTWAWSFLSQYLPLAYLVSCVVTWIGFEMVTDSAALVALGVIKMLSAV